MFLKINNWIRRTCDHLRLIPLALPCVASMSSWHNVFTFVISTICSLGAMIGLIVASTISLHQHHGLPRPTLLMGSIAVPTARSDDPGVLTTSRSPRPLVVHGINSLQHQDLLLVHDHVSQQQRQSQHWRTWRHDSPTLSWHDSMAIYGRACWIHSSRFPSSSTYDSLSCPQTSGRQLRSAAAQGGVSAHWAGHDIAATTQQLYSTLHTVAQLQTAHALQSLQSTWYHDTTVNAARRLSVTCNFHIVHSTKQLPSAFSHLQHGLRYKQVNRLAIRVLQ